MIFMVAGLLPLIVFQGDLRNGAADIEIIAAANDAIPRVRRQLVAALATLRPTRRSRSRRRSGFFFHRGDLQFIIKQIADVRRRRRWDMNRPAATRTLYCFAVQLLVGPESLSAAVASDYGSVPSSRSFTWRRPLNLREFRPALNRLDYCKS